MVLRTFSKAFSLAGMRVGLAFGSEDIVRNMLKVKDSYNLCRLSLTAALAALEDVEWMRRNVGRIQRTRKTLIRGLRKLGFDVQPSQANFVMAKLGSDSIRWLHEGLRDRGILVRFFDTPDLQQHDAGHGGETPGDPGAAQGKRKTCCTAAASRSGRRSSERSRPNNSIRGRMVPSVPRCRRHSPR